MWDGKSVTPKKIEMFSIKSCDIYEPNDLYNINTIDELHKTKEAAILEYIDAAEEESAALDT